MAVGEAGPPGLASKCLDKELKKILLLHYFPNPWVDALVDGFICKCRKGWVKDTWSRRAEEDVVTDRGRLSHHNSSIHSSERSSSINKIRKRSNKKSSGKRSSSTKKARKSSNKRSRDKRW